MPHRLLRNGKEWISSIWESDEDIGRTKLKIKEILNDTTLERDTPGQMVNFKKDPFDRIHKRYAKHFM